ncbi:MAG TPA: sulfite exporter TauE/SafE family protein [Candidatus Methylacidiphilales bacterium]|jgi:hypothetical protein|nr:sulfite exporter TauE/SafE family protein [Candidatus Methylacidiphilales bacterium]
MSSLASLHFSALGWLAVAGGALGIGLNKGGLTGLGILPVLLFAVVLDPRQSTGFVLPLLIIGDICAVVIYRRVVLWKVFWHLLPPALIGIIIGYLLMGPITIRGVNLGIPEAIYGRIIGWLILSLLALQLVRGVYGEKLDHFFESHGFGIAMGVLAGIATMLANAAGPVSTLYFVSVGLPKWNLIGTSSFLFFVINLCKVPFSASLGLTNVASLTMAFILLPLVILGFFAGSNLTAIVPQKIFDRFLLVCTAIGALKLIG